MTKTSFRPATVAAVAALAVMVSAAGSAQAGRCLYPSVSAPGPIRANIQSARYAAMDAWSAKVRKTKGGKFSAWSSAGDQTVDCIWNERGNKIRCQASASACSY